MSLKKQFLKSKPVCKVTFRLTKEQAKNSETVNLVGDFNDWNKSTTQMTKLKSGDFSIVLPLESGKNYEFRYLLNNTEWTNDWDADDYTPSQIGGSDNSVVHCIA